MARTISKVVGLSVALHAALLLALSNLPKAGAQSDIVGSDAVKISFYYSANGTTRSQTDNGKNAVKARPSIAGRKHPLGHFSQKVPESTIESQGQQPDVITNSVTNLQLNNTGSTAFHLPILERDSVIVPRFTDDALNRGFRGILIFELTLDEQGRVVETRLRNPSGLSIDEEAIVSAKNARYLPARDFHGRPISSIAELSFAFLGH